MNSLRGNLILAGTILLAGILIAYRPFQSPQPHYQLIVRDDAFIQFDPTTGQVWVLAPKVKADWIKLPPLRFTPPPLNSKELPKPQFDPSQPFERISPKPKNQSTHTNASWQPPEGDEIVKPFRSNQSANTNAPANSVNH